jgi:drug/metabolite transporter (DMT)-like permease
MASSTFLAIATALLFAVNIHIQRVALRDTDIHSGAVLSVAGMTLFFWLLAPFFLQPEWFLQPVVIYIVLLGLLWPAMGQSMQIAAVQRVGAPLTSSIAAITPLFAVLIAIWLLHEPLTWLIAFGMFFMISGLILAAWSPSKNQRTFPLWTICLPAGAAFARGVAQPISKWSMQDIGSAYFVTLIAGTVSLALLLALRKIVRRPSRMGRHGTRLFLFGGAVNGVGIYTLNLALQQGNVAEVASIVATTPLWSLLLEALWFRQEKLTMRHLVVAVLVFSGSVLVIGR